MNAAAFGPVLEITVIGDPTAKKKGEAPRLSSEIALFVFLR